MALDVIRGIRTRSDLNQALLDQRGCPSREARNGGFLQGAVEGRQHLVAVQNKMGGPTLRRHARAAGVGFVVKFSGEGRILALLL